MTAESLPRMRRLQERLVGREKRVLFLAALLVRAAIGLAGDMNYFSDEPSLKAAEGAFHIHRGDGYSEHWREFVYARTHETRQERFITYGELAEAHRNGLEAPPRPLLSHPPGYSLLMWIFLAAGFKSFLPAFIVQVVLDSLVPVLLFAIIARRLGAAVALTGGLIYAVYPPFAAAASAATMDSLLPFLSAVMIVVHEKALRESSLARWAALGAVAGLACYFRPNFLVYPAVIFAVSFLMHKHFLRACVHAAVAAAAILAALSPWAAYNHHRVGTWVFSSTGGGVTLCHGLAQAGGPWDLPKSDEEARERLAALGLEWHGLEADRYFHGEFRKAVAEHPLAYAVAVAKRVPRVLRLKSFWGIAHAHTEKGYGSHYRAAHGTWKGLYMYFQENRRAVVSRVFIVGAWTVEALFLMAAYAGIFLAFRRHGAMTAALLAPALCLVLSCVMVNVESRFILPGTVAYPYFAWIALAAFLDWRGGITRGVFE